MMRIQQLMFPMIMVMAVLCNPGCPKRTETPAADETAKAVKHAKTPKQNVIGKPIKRTETKVANETGKTLIVIETSMGTIKAELWPEKAPETVANFMKYVDEGFYDGLIFHRVIDGFMIQGGGFDQNMNQKPSHKPIRNEASAELLNLRGTLAMARTNVVDSATAQFFINLADNDFLNHKGNAAAQFGYCAFGEVVEGMDVVSSIGKVKTATSGHFENVPVKTVKIESIRRAK